VNKHSFVSRSLAVLAACVLIAPAAANATPYVVTLTQQGSNIVAAGSGSFDLTGLTFEYTTVSVAADMEPDTAYIGNGPTTFITDIDAYGGFTGPTSFGIGTGGYAATGSGDWVGIWGSSAIYGAPTFWVPSGYVSGTPLSNSAIYDSASFASLGLTPGTYVWTWGTGADQSFTLQIGNAVGVPEPAALGAFGLGLLLIGGFMGLRRRTAQ
jgi:hypothetical protein